MNALDTSAGRSDHFGGARGKSAPGVVEMLSVRAVSAGTIPAPMEVMKVWWDVDIKKNVKNVAGMMIVRPWTALSGNVFLKLMKVSRSVSITLATMTS